MNIQRYYGDWDSLESMQSSFYNQEIDVKDEEIIYANYESSGYEGSCIVIYQRDGKVFEMASSHCSCNGLDWEADEVSWDQLAMRKPDYNWPQEAIDVVRQHIPRA